MIQRSKRSSIAIAHRLAHAVTALVILGKTIEIEPERVRIGAANLVLTIHNLAPLNPILRSLVARPINISRDELLNVVRQRHVSSGPCWVTQGKYTCSAGA